jgi:pimeloyl-ACP methyl ester carboxylesterase
VTDLLSAQGWSIRTVELPTVHAAGKDLLGLQDDADAVSAAVDEITGPVVVVAHSYGGVPTTQGALDPRVQHIVYIAAFVLDEGESLLAAVGGVAPDWWHVNGPVVTAGDASQPPQHLFYGDVDPQVADAATARLVDQSVRAFTEPLTRVAWRDRPTTYVITEDDVIFPVEAQEALSARAGSRVVRLATSHSPFLSQPDAVAEIISAAASDA